MQTVQSYLTPLTKAVRNPASLGQQTAKTAEKTAEQAINNPQTFLTRLRNLDHATLTTVGVTTAEVIGFFSVGEMLGRFKIIGYRSSGAHAEHH
jgi:F-type H+-transporting ATPase subunit g